MIFVFRSLKGECIWDHHGLLEVVGDSRTRGHFMRLKKFYNRLDISKHSFTQRIVNVWNSLPEEVVRVDTVGAFKRKFDKWIAD